MTRPPALGESFTDERDALPAVLRGLPRVVHELEIAGRSWRVEAIADQSALTGLAESFAEFPFGLLLWDAAPVLATALVDLGEAIADRGVLELGAGVGLVGLVAQASGARVLQTDHGAEALALARANARRNRIDGIAWALADWTDWRETRTFDLVIGSDILYEPALHGALLAIFAKNLAPGGRVLLTDPGRTTTPRFITAMETAGWKVERRRRKVPAITPLRPGEMVTVTIIEAWR